MRHRIPDDITNSQVIAAIDEYVRLERDREILKNHWFKGHTFERLAEDNDLSVNKIKDIVYGKGDAVLLQFQK